MLQFHRRHPFIADAIGLALVSINLELMLLFRDNYLQPRAWGIACAAVNRPMVCMARDADGWLSGYYGWGAAALYAGLLTLIHAPSGVSVAAVSLGALAIVNGNATWGAIAVCLGAWSWMRRDFYRN